MDADLDGDIDGVDISFIMLALAKKYRFLIQKPVLKAANCRFNVQATFMDHEGRLVADGSKTKVKMEVRSAAGSAVAFGSVVSGGKMERRQDSVVVEMKAPVGGMFEGELEVTGVGKVEIVLMLYTFSSAGETEKKRRFPWYGTSYGEFADAGFEFTPVASHVVTVDECGVTTSRTATSTLFTEPSATTTAFTGATSVTNTTTRINTTSSTAATNTIITKNDASKIGPTCTHVRITE